MDILEAEGVVGTTGAVHEKLIALKEAIASDYDGFFTNTMVIDELICLLIQLTSEDGDASR